MLGYTLASIRAMLGPTSKSSLKGHIRAEIKVMSCWAKTKVVQDEDHVGVHIDQHQGHVGANLKVSWKDLVRVLLDQDEGRSR